MNIHFFQSHNLFDASINLFTELGVPIKSLTKQPLSVREILATHYKKNPTFEAISELYYIGTIDDQIFQSQTSNSMFDTSYAGYTYDQALLQSQKNYNGLMLFALHLNAYPNRTQIAEITRAFNRISQKMPVGVLLKYPHENTHCISLAITERFNYLQKWRQGEKVGKVIMLKDISVQNTHTGHLKILQQLNIQGKKIHDFNQLHQHWIQILNANLLNKQFYQELSQWYFWAMDKVQFPDDIEPNTEKRNAENLIRLITRFIFIWFMKEKKLIPDTIFDKEFLDTLLFYHDKTKSTYYKAILQNLFFATLSTPMKKDEPNSRIFIEDAQKYGHKNDGYLQQGFYRYSRFIKDKNTFLQLFQNVPFLNGGLFDCLDTRIGTQEIRIDCFSDNPKNETRLQVPDELFFTEQELTVDLSKYIEGAKKRNVTGLIPLLNKYIFTIAENTPIEEDIALDPELLGNVFENLLAAYNPETASTARKATGSYYTPREIVDYMVDETLLTYLKNNTNHLHLSETSLRNLLSYDYDENPFTPQQNQHLIEAIDKIKILDPACGSGAFLMGILNKMVLILNKIDPKNTYWKQKILQKVPPEIKDETEKSFANKPLDYIRKLGLIEHCIYGLDIQPIAIQISKLRFFISLLVEQKVDDTKPNRDIRALPNLETKFVAANTLIELYHTQKLQLSSEKTHQLQDKLFQLREELFYANSRSKKLQLQEQEKYVRQQLKVEYENIGMQQEVVKKITDWNPFNQNAIADWFNPKFMFGITDGFDIVIGNPPYIQLQKNGGKLADMYKNLKFETFERMGDIYSLFYERGIQLLKPNGILAYITSNKWMRAGYGKSTRAFFCKHNPLSLIDLGSGVFQSATVDTNILLIQKTLQKPTQYQLKALDLTKEKNIDSFDAFADRWTTLTQLSDDAWAIANELEQSIKQKIEKKGTPLKNWDIQINYGIKTGYNEAFIIDGKKKDELIAQDPKSAEIIKPILRGRDIKRYKAEFADLWLIATHNGIKDKGIPRINVEKDYPAIYAHLKQFEPQLQKRQDKGDHWTNLRNCAYYPEFEKEKIVWAEMTNENNFILDKNKFLCNQTCYFIANPPKHLIAFLNSQLIYYYFSKVSASLGEGAFRWIKQYVEQIPIPKLSEEAQLPFVRLVEQILALKEQGKDTTALEAEIDRLVYQLYELTQEEIAVIENSK
jgi:hypothetical protein